MIVNHAFKFIFLKTRKTAGTSIEIALSRYCGEGDIVTPLGASDEAIRTSLGYRGPQNCGILLRDYTWRDWWRTLRGRRVRLKNHSSAERIRRVVGARVWNSYFKFCVERNPFDKAISRYNWNTREAEHRGQMGEFLESLPQFELSNWEIYAIDGEIAVDRVLRYENLEIELEEVRCALGLPPEPLELPRAKAGYSSDGRHYSQLLDPKCRIIIETRCAREITALGHGWRDGPNVGFQRTPISARGWGQLTPP